MQQLQAAHSLALGHLPLLRSGGTGRSRAAAAAAAPATTAPTGPPRARHEAFDALPVGQVASRQHRRGLEQLQSALPADRAGAFSLGVDGSGNIT